MIALGGLARVWIIFQPCFWAVEMTDLRAAKVSAPDEVHMLPGSVAGLAAALGDQGVRAVRPNASSSR